MIETSTTTAEKVPAEATTLREELGRLDEERRILERQISLARQEIVRQQLDKARLQKQLDDVEGEYRRFSERYVEVQQHNNDLTHLTVASQRLHESTDRHEVLNAIQEIIINLLGSEELGVFELAEDGKSLRLVNSFGINEERFKSIPLGLGSIGGAALQGKSTIFENGHEGLTACVPLMAGEKVIGAVAVFKLLPQKGKLDAVDRDLLDLLRSQAGVALYCTRVVEAHTRAARVGA